VRVPRSVYPIQDLVARHLPLRPPQARGLALWVCGTLLARSATQSAVVAALAQPGRENTVRQRLREWLRDGADKARPCATQVDVEACFAPLLRWVASRRPGRDLPLAIDVTTRRADLTVLAVCVLCGGCAIPVAWRMLPGNRPGPWLDPLLALMARLRAGVPPGRRVVVLTDRGLWSPRLWAGLCEMGFTPLMRVHNHTRVTLRKGEPARRAGSLVEAGQAWVGRVTLGRVKPMPVTLALVRARGQAEPWAVATTLAPGTVGARDYGLRMWVELGFRALKSGGLQWQATRRCKPERAARHWLVLAVAALLSLAQGSRMEAHAGVAPDQGRTVSLFRRGLIALSKILGTGRGPPGRWRLSPQTWPDLPPGVVLINDPIQPC
jgi:hypothetical protein